MFDKLPESATTGALGQQDQRKLMMAKMLMAKPTAAPGAFEGMTGALSNGLGGMLMGQVMKNNGAQQQQLPQAAAPAVPWMNPDHVPYAG